MTISLSEEAYRTTKVYSVQRKISMNKAINELLNSLDSPQKPLPVESQELIYKDPLTGLPVMKCNQKITLEDLRRLEEEEDRWQWERGNS